MNVAIQSIGVCHTSCSARPCHERGPPGRLVRDFERARQALGESGREHVTHVPSRQVAIPGERWDIMDNSGNDALRTFPMDEGYALSHPFLR